MIKCLTQEIIYSQVPEVLPNGFKKRILGQQTILWRYK